MKFNGRRKKILYVRIRNMNLSVIIIIITVDRRK